MSKGYSALPQDGNYAQPTGYAGGEQPPQYPGYAGENQPLHQPVNNSFGTQQQDFYQQQYQQPHVQQQPPAPGYGATGYHQERPQPAFNPHYNPAPPAPVMQQQSSTNVVVVNQQPQAQPQAVVHVAPRANSYMVLTAVLMILCFLHGNLPSFICLLPALICAYQAQEHNRTGQYSQAKSCGQFALFCNILSIAYFALIVVAGIALIIVVVTIGLTADPDPDS